MGNGMGNGIGRGGGRGIRVAVAWGQPEAQEVEPALKLLDRVLRILWRLTH